MKNLTNKEAKSIMNWMEENKYESKALLVDAMIEVDSNLTEKFLPKIVAYKYFDLYEHPEDAEEALVEAFQTIYENSPVALSLLISLHKQQSWNTFWRRLEIVVDKLVGTIKNI